MGTEVRHSPGGGHRAMVGLSPGWDVGPWVGLAQQGPWLAGPGSRDLEPSPAGSLNGTGAEGPGVDVRSWDLGRVSHFGAEVSQGVMRAW